MNRRRFLGSIAAITAALGVTRVPDSVQASEMPVSDQIAQARADGYNRGREVEEARQEARQDDAPYIQGMIDQAAAMGGGSVLLEPRTHYLRATLTMRSGVTLDGRGAHLVGADGVDTLLVIPGDVERVGVINTTFHQARQAARSAPHAHCGSACGQWRDMLHDWSNSMTVNTGGANIVGYHEPTTPRLEGFIEGYYAAADAALIEIDALRRQA